MSAGLNRRIRAAVVLALMLVLASWISGVRALSAAYAVSPSSGSGAGGQGGEVIDGEAPVFTEGTSGGTVGSDVDGKIVRLTVDTITSADSSLDGAVVQFTGEAIGEELIADGGNVWVSVEDEGALVSVYMTREQADVVKNYGSHLRRGTTLKIIGELHCVCRQHDGELDVHATEVEEIRRGGASKEHIDTWKLYAGLVLTGLGLALIAAHRFLRYDAS